MASHEAAKAAVTRISDNFGYLNTEELEEIGRVNPDLRAKVERSLLAKDKLAGHAIITLAQNIYGSDARFVFELLQNADDNNFTIALASGAPPSVSFHVYADRIVVECNEDGFTKEDIQAICSVGGSSKSTSHGYIGAKGIGFKSVFIAAWKVHVQSGHFSFYFAHRKGDSGLGMVMPIWQDTEELLEGPVTRMTLYFHDTGDEKHLGHLRETIFKQLSDLQETSLLFLRKLKKINVSFYDEKETFESSRSLCSTSINDYSVLLETTKTQTSGVVTTSTKQFHITRHMASNLSKSVSRQIPETDEAARAAAEAEVVLAFPLTNKLEPVIEKQEFFAFLPIRESDFSFIIQSDFDTSANRQDIVTSSQRNIDLLDAIADAFVKAVLEFCKHTDLCYTWPKFLPPLQDGSTGFWARLKDKIQQSLSVTPVLRARHGSQLRKIDNVVILAGDFKDDKGDPLLDDIISNEFLSGAYSTEVETILQGYGLQMMASDLIERMLRADLEQATSKMKSPFTSQRWHSQMATLLSRFASSSQFRGLAHLPLSGGNWVSPASGPVYLPSAAGIPIPEDVNIRILDRAAVANTDREALFKQYGAVEPSVAYVRSSIERLYRSMSRKVGLTQSKPHLHFLFLSHQCEPKATRSTYRCIYLYSNRGPYRRPQFNDVLLPTDHPYGAKKLLEHADSAPYSEVWVFHSMYLLEPPVTPHGQHLSWERWLCDFIGVRDRLRLIQRNGKALSETWIYVGTHMPDKLLGLLEYLWKYEGSQIRSNNELKAHVQDTKADKLCISSLSKPLTLKETFLPLASLERHCERFMEQSEPFPFLKLDSEMSQERLRTKWLFLHEDMLVGIEDDTRFFLEVLFWIKQANPDPRTHPISRHQRLVDLYVIIEAKLAASADSETEKKVVVDFINTNKCLYVPRSTACAPAWTDTTMCVWDGPSDMRCKYSLKDILTQSFGLDRIDQISRFFQQVLQIPDVSCEHLITELRSLKEDVQQDFDHISMLYKRIAASSYADENTRCLLRSCFATENLICVFEGETAGWYKTGECLWSSTTHIKGKVTLSDDYADLKEFFLDILDVKELTLQMVYDELLQTNQESSIDEIKSAIWSLNALLQSEPGVVNPGPLMRKRIFPVASPSGCKILAHARFDFSIGDREYLTARFRGRIRMLDFDLAEVRQLTTFLNWMKLSKRFMSESVKEVTSPGNGIVRTVSSANRDLKLKAHALLRVAASFNSPRYTANGSDLYNTLRSINTVATDEILSVLSLSQNGSSITVESRAGDMHIGESDGKVTIYVPWNKAKQEFCFASPLPTNLAAWLMRDPVTQIQEEVDKAMVTALAALLIVTPSAVNLVLDHQGVIQVPIVNEDLGSYDDHETVTSADEDNEHGVAMVRYVRPAADEPLTAGYEVTEVFTEQERTGYRGYGGYGSFHPPLQQIDSDDDDHQYRELLKKVVRAARRAQFPSRGSFDMSALRSVLSDDAIVGYNGFESTQRYRPNNQLERNFKVGAAGELYVFEIMSRLDPALRGWHRDNWQSNIRGRVSIHEDYVGMSSWKEPETADLIYDDIHGDLTTTLIDRGYLNADEWRHARPYYYIEVKTTTGACGTPFYMSKNQYQRMTRIHDTAGQREVYLILRVFEIESEEQIGMKVYIDPRQLGLEGELVFTAEGWSVIAGAI